MKKNKKGNKSKEKDIVFDILKILCFIGLGIVLFELIFFGMLVLKNRNQKINVDVAQKILLTSDGYIKVGSSNFYNSDYNKKTDVESGIISVYKDDKIVKEIQYKDQNRVVFTDAVEINNGYIVIGTKVINKKGKKVGLLLKLSKDGEVLLEKTYDNLDRTVFKKVLLDNNEIVIVGNSHYSDKKKDKDAKGAFVIKYDLNGNLLYSNSFGSSVSGSFNDIIKIMDNYYAVGSLDVETATIVKYDKSLKEISSKTYDNVNSSGFTKITNYNDKIYLTYAKTEEKDNKRVEQASILVADYNYKELNKLTYDKEDYSIWNDFVIYKDDLYLVGDSAKRIGKKKSILVDFEYKGIIAKYDNKLNLKWLKEFDYNNNDYYKSLLINNDKIFVTGSTNSKIKNLESNKNNFSSFINVYDLNGKFIK